ncbi:hypothetical protein [Aureispira anguillae]|uniref:Uncharacterized protein n=1 Tax=Aureispira anguillae TaxID=2864201 RepID=A0A916DVJ4_9BACT|nr:hypothetical protein [Aureispira anguillae]BDS15204.1 hypothetical protein AsAng_0059880 [Aureispira anguillae]
MGEFFLFMVTVIGVPMTFYYLSSYFKIKLNHLKQQHNLQEPGQASKDTKQQIRYLMAENEEMKEELRNIKYLLSQNSRQKIDLDYEREQMKLDYDAKGSLSL